MDDQNHVPPETGRTSTLTLRDLLAIGFRHRRLVVLSYLGILLTAFVVALLLPPQYEAQLKILVKRERIDPAVSSEERESWQGVTEEELNSEVELLRSRDLLAKVVVASGLHERDTEIPATFAKAAVATGLQESNRGILVLLRKLVPGRTDQSPPAEKSIAEAVRGLEEDLTVQLLRKSNVIHVSYASPDPILSATVLKKLADQYLEKHLAVHRPSGAFDFFERETEQYRTRLSSLQTLLTQHERDEGIVSSVQFEKEAAFRQLADLEATRQATQVQIAATQKRIVALRAQARSTPARTTTQIRKVSAGLVEQLRGSLSTLELKRIELLEVFQPGYPPVHAVEKQITKLQATISAAEQSPLLEETTDRNPTHQFLQTELAEAQSELAALQAHAAATTEAISTSREKARRLAQIEFHTENLIREAKQAEQNYLIYARKREEARISDALDAQRIVNVAVAEEPTQPFEPAGPPRSLIVLLGGFFAGLMSVAMAFAADYRDPSFRTPDEVWASLGTPVLAAIPRNGK